LHRVGANQKGSNDYIVSVEKQLAMLVRFPATFATTSVAKQIHVRHRGASAEPTSGGGSRGTWKFEPFDLTALSRSLSCTTTRGDGSLRQTIEIGQPFATP
jgi:hypothetical protein